MNGKFIVIEGIDGCGKTTQIEAIYKWLPSSGLLEKNSQIIKTREPGGTKFGKRIREILLDNDQEYEPSDLTELLLYAADRAEHVSKIISPELNNSDHWLLGISPEGIGVIGMILNFLIMLLVTKSSKSPPESVINLVESIRRP